MKQFLKDIAGFTLVCAAAGAILWLVAAPLASQLRYHLGDDIHSIVIGDSHIQAAIDGRLLSNCINVGVNAEATYFSYYRIKEYLARNPQLKKVYLGFSHHNLSSYYHAFIHGAYSENIAARYFPVLPSAEQQKLLLARSYRLPIFIKDVIKYNLIELEYGYYNPFQDTRAADSLMDRRLQEQFYQPNGSLQPFSNTNLQALKQLKNLCDAEGIELVLLNTPVHSYYDKRIPEAYKEQYDATIDTLDVKVIDFEGLVLTDTSFTPDGDHVSSAGAQIITTYFEVVLK